MIICLIGWSTIHFDEYYQNPTEVASNKCYSNLDAIHVPTNILALPTDQRMKVYDDLRCIIVNKMMIDVCVMQVVYI